jgi:hypothetical protein
MLLMAFAPSVLAVDGLVLYTRAPGGSRYTGEGELRLARLAADSLREHIVIDYRVLSAQLSPSCDRIAYVRLVDGKEEIVVCGLDGADKRVLKGAMEHPGDVRWCAYLCWRMPDRILYSYQKSNSVFSISPETGDTSVYFTSQYGFSKVSCSEDGQRLSIRARSGYNGVVTIDRQSGEEKKIGGGCSNWLSPDGSMFTHCNSGWSRYVVRQWDGTVYKTYASPEEDKHLAHWSHNSNDWILFQCGAETLIPWSHLWIQQVHTGRAVRLTEHQMWNDAGRDFWVGAKALPQGMPVIRHFRAAPAPDGSSGSVLLSWEAGNASSVKLVPEVETGMHARDSVTVSVDTEITYLLIASNAGMADTARLAVADAQASPPRIVAPAAAELVEGQTYLLQGTGSNLSWLYDANSDKKPRIAVGTGPEVSFTVPHDVADPRTLTLILRDGNGREATRQYNITAPPLVLLSPNGGEVYQAGEMITVEWRADTSILTEVVVDISFDAGRSWRSLLDSGSISLYDSNWPRYQVTVPGQPGDAAWMPSESSTKCRIRVAPYDNPNASADKSDADFTLLVGSIDARVPLTVTVPDGGEVARSLFNMRGQEVIVPPCRSAGGRHSIPAGVYLRQPAPAGGNRGEKWCRF